ncbi:hypothetical protein F4808DRAFT_465885 [Astrocystis sublimbata]|nr:hypothetical protein F4808DRAFT_465885 [Astrocystis sublimbata]
MPTLNWKPGDVAFLKRAETFDDAEQKELLDSRRLFPGATGHPVIVLDCSNNSWYYIVTTVSAYSSSEENNYLPPWQQLAHIHKDINGFRAFSGSRRPNENYEFLRLADKKQWPKPETSWIYIHHPYLVPASTLIRYTKARGQQLRMEPNSLKDLLRHTERQCRKFRRLQAELRQKNNRYPPTEKNFQQSGHDYGHCVPRIEYSNTIAEKTWCPTKSHISMPSATVTLVDITNNSNSSNSNNSNNATAEKTPYRMPTR